MTTKMYLSRLFLTLFVAMGLAFGHAAMAADDKDKQDDKDHMPRVLEEDVGNNLPFIVDEEFYQDREA